MATKLRYTSATPKPAGDPDPGQRPHDRVEQERDQRGDEEEEDDVTRGARDHPQQQKQHREADELNPARDLNLRGPGGRPGHVGHRTSRVVPLRPPAWDWDFAVDGSLAVQPRQVPLQEEAASVTVPRMPRASGHALVMRRRAEVAAARRKRRLAGLALLASVALVTLLLTAFGSGGSGAVRTAAPAPATRLLPAGPPRPQVVALQGTLRLQLPVAQGRVTAIGYHASGNGALTLDPVGRQANQGLVDRVAAEPLRRRHERPALLRARRRAAGRRRARSTSAPFRAPTSTRRSTARSSGSRRTS